MMVNFQNWAHTFKNISFEEHGSWYQIVLEEKINEVLDSGSDNATTSPLFQQKVNTTANGGANTAGAKSIF